jgi:hypothetical protein
MIGLRDSGIDILRLQAVFKTIRYKWWRPVSARPICPVCACELKAVQPEWPVGALSG